MFKRLFAVSLIVAGTLGIYTSVQAAEPVKIGFSIPKTGLFSPACPSQLNAYLVCQDLAFQLF